MKTTNIILLVLLLVGSVFAQTGANVNVNGFPSSVSNPTQFLDYDGSGNTIYICTTNPLSPNNYNPNYNFSLSVGGGTLTSIVVATNVGTVTTVNAHGLMVGQKVIVSGSTTTALNATYFVQTVPSSTTFTITTAGVGNATYNDTGMTLSGSLPLLTSPIWTIEKLNYNSSNNLINVMWAGGTPGNYTKTCANRAVTTGATAIYYQ